MSYEPEQHENYPKEEMKSVYSKIASDHATNPRNLGYMEDADGFALLTGPCGDTMQIWIQVNGGIITDATFTTDGCGNSIASCSMVTEMCKGKSIIESREIEQQDILNALGALPEEGEHCALLAANTLKVAIADYLTRQNS